MDGDALRIRRNIYATVRAGSPYRFEHLAGPIGPRQLPLSQVRQGPAWARRCNVASCGEVVGQNTVLRDAEVAAAIGAVECDFVGHANGFSRHGELFGVKRLRIHRALAVKDQVTRIGIGRI